MAGGKVIPGLVPPGQLFRRCVVHPPELDRALAPCAEADAHVQLPPILRAKVVLRDLPSTRDLAFDDEVVSLPAAFCLDIAAAFFLLGDLPAVAVEHQGRVAVQRKRQARISLGDRERRGRIEHELHRLVHPLALLVAHSAPRPATPTPAEASTSTIPTALPATR